MDSMTKRRVVLWPYLLILLLASFALCLAAPFSWTDKMPLSDSTIFLYIGKSMNSGLTLYQSLFDHKGPLLFLINAVGLRIGGEFGVWLLGVASFLFGFLLRHVWCSQKEFLLFWPFSLSSLLSSIVLRGEIILKNMLFPLSPFPFLFSQSIF